MGIEEYIRCCRIKLSSKESSKTAWKRDNLRVSISSVPSIEETGLDFSLYGEGLPYFTPHDSLPPNKRPSDSTALSCSRSLSLPTERSRGEHFYDALDALQLHRADDDDKEPKKEGKFRLLKHLSLTRRSSKVIPRQDQIGRKKSKSRRSWGDEVPVKDVHILDYVQDEDVIAKKSGEDVDDSQRLPLETENEKLPGSVSLKDLFQEKSLFKSSSDGTVQQFPVARIDSSAKHSRNASTLCGILEDEVSEFDDTAGSSGSMSHDASADSAGSECDIFVRTSPKGSTACPSTEAHSEINLGNRDEIGGDSLQDGSAKPCSEPSATLVRSEPASNPELQSTIARDRWRRLRHTVTFANHMSRNVKINHSDLLEHEADIRVQQDGTNGDAGRVGAAAFEGARTRTRLRARGRRGMDGLLVRQNKGIISLVQDFYVACLKMPISHFLIGVFLAPLALGLLFTPVYLFDMEGLTFEGVILTQENISRLAAAKQQCTMLVSVFLYALSLSTTFGGSPVAALSPFCLLVANLNTLMAQFLFVFLSGAVFARMSQPSHPVRCSKKAIIKNDEFTSTPASTASAEKFKVFAVRLVLTGPPPCELVDAKICLTFRIFIKLPSGSMFCSTQDLDLVRPEVSYLRYGIMVRHIIDHKSPVYGHTMESLVDGDASFSLTIMGLERTSMQPIFHLEDYFVCDGDVAWDADYVDFIHVNSEGQRVLDHSKIDLLREPQSKKEGIIMGGPNLKESSEDDAKTNLVRQRKAGHKGWIPPGIVGAKLWSSKSVSFTRAEW